MLQDKHLYKTGTQIQNHHLLLGAYVCVHVCFWIEMILVFGRVLRNVITLLTFCVTA